MATSTVVVAREDLTIPGAVEASGLDTNDPEHIENELFKTLEQNKADAVLLDLTASRGQGVAAIRRIRRRSAVPILVVCRPEDTLAADYRRAGAAACMNPPIDLMQMKEALGRQDASNGRSTAPLFVSAAAEGIRFAGYVLRPRDNRLIGPDDTEVALSAIETRVLQHLAETPGIVWPAAAIAEAVQGAHAGRAGNADRTVGPVIARLRKKLARLGGAEGQHLIKTQIGHGYMLDAEAVPAWPALTAARRA
ncbi:MAG TPA: winged helix-turn-helix domain-containing protein [Stellaceae bacterium]|jgi:two-component system OmpR family response regulator